MSGQPDLSTLPQRMRYAASVLTEANENGEYVASGSRWTPAELLAEAKLIEAEQRSAAERDALVEQLIDDLSRIWRNTHPAGLAYALSQVRSWARELVESGWRKGEPA